MGTRLRHETEDLATLALALGLVPVDLVASARLEVAVLSGRTRRAGPRYFGDSRAS